MPAPKPKRHEWRSIAEYGWPKRGEEVEFLICKNPIALIPACMTDSDLTEGTGKLCSIAGDSPILWRYLDLPKRRMNNDERNN